jgi:hypothetical protein
VGWVVGVGVFREVVVRGFVSVGDGVEKTDVDIFAAAEYTATIDIAIVDEIGDISEPLLFFLLTDIVTLFDIISIT